MAIQRTTLDFFESLANKEINLLVTLPETKLAPENMPSQKETRYTIISFQVLY